jgi:phosphoenolpyruvate carboxykinase (ATP)
MIQSRQIEAPHIPHARVVGLDAIGLRELRTEHWNLTAPQLVEEALKRDEGWLSSHGAFIAHTGQHTGRSAKDKFIVRGPVFGPEIWWDSPYQKELSGDHFDALWADLIEHYRGKDAFVLDAWAGADTEFRLAVRVVTENAWHNHFSRNMFIPATPEETRTHEPEFTVISAPSFKANPKRHGSRSETMIAISLKRRIVLIVGTSYAGEIKKSIFTVLNHLLPEHHVMPMHCSANVGQNGDVALFFGMSGTGKTTLSADPTRGLIGDDEHGWTESGVFNFEGGCYAKVIKLNPDAEPEIHRTTRTFGTVLENVVFDMDTRELDLDDGSLTENTRAAYPLSMISNAVIPSLAGHPKHIVFLAADAFGVLPPISKLTSAQAMYYFLCGYTAKVAGTEKGIIEPQASFETAFGAPFLTRPPQVYADLLREKIEHHQVNVWLINTGWSGGPASSSSGSVGSRIKIAHTRAMVRAALEGTLTDVPFKTHPIFGLEMPTRVDGVPSEVLNPRETWLDPVAYDAQATKLAGMFRAFFTPFEADVSEAVRNAGPKAE